MELKQILAIFIRQKRLISSIFLGVVLIFVVVTLLVEPRYEAKARVYLRKSPASNVFFNTTGLLSSVTGTVDDTERYNYLAVATSYPVMEKVVDTLGLTRSRKIIQLFEMIPFGSTLLDAIGVQRTRKVMLPNELSQKELVSFFFPRPLVSVEQFEDTDILEISASDASLEGAIALANAVAGTFISQLGEMQQTDFIRVKKVTEDALPKAETRLKAAQEQLQHFKEQCGYVDITNYTSELITKISTIRGRIEENGLHLVGSKSKLVAIKSELLQRPEFRKSSMAFVRNPKLDALQTSLQSLYLDIVQARTQYTDKHPDVVAYEAQIADIKRRMKEETEKSFSADTYSTDPIFETLTSSFTDVTVAIKNFESLISADHELLTTYEGKLHRLPETAATYARLSTAATAAETFYSSLLGSMERLKTAERINYSDVTLLESAMPPDTPSKAKRPKLFGKVAVGVALGAFLALGAALLVEYLDETVRDLSQLAEEEGMIDLGAVPFLPDALTQRVDTSPVLREAIRRVVTRLRQQNEGQLAGGIMLTSPGRGEGKAFIAASLGRNLALSGKRTLLVDGDLHEPHVHTAFGIDNGIGLADCLDGGAGMEQAARELFPDLVVITAGRTDSDPGLLVDSSALDSFLTKAKQFYDVVLLTSAPLNEVVDAAVYAPRFDICIFIGSYGCTERSQYLAAVRSLPSVAPLHAALLNNVPPTAKEMKRKQRSRSTFFLSLLAGQKKRKNRV